MLILSKEQPVTACRVFSLVGGKSKQTGTRIGTRGSDDGLVQIRRLGQSYKGTWRDSSHAEVFHIPSLLSPMVQIVLLTQ